MKEVESINWKSEGNVASFKDINNHTVQM